MISLGLLAAAALSAASLTTSCDLAASHPSDPDRAAPGLESAQIDLKVAEATCRTAHAAAPEHARTAYHLGRLIYYQGRRAEALPFLERAADGGYRQGIFVLGYLLSLGEPGVTKDVCRAQELWRRGAGLDHPWSGYHLVEKQLAGAFAACPRQVSPAESARFLDLAQRRITVAESAGRVEALTARAGK